APFVRQAIRARLATGQRLGQEQAPARFVLRRGRAHQAEVSGSLYTAGRPRVGLRSNCVEILGTTRLTKQKWLNLFRRRFLHNRRDGTLIFASPRAKPYKRTDACDAVVIVPVVMEEGRPNRLVVIREYRVTLQAYEFTFPA